MSKEKNIKCKWLHVRLTEDEHNKIHKKFSASTCRKLSEYSRRVLLDKIITVNYRNHSLDDFMTEMIKLRNELNAIGNNLNQSVKKLHTLNPLNELSAWMIQNENQKKILFEEVEEIKNKINKISDEWVAVIHGSKSVRNALHYNENKVRQKVAKFIHAGNYAKDTNLLGFTDKINRLEKLIALNQQTKVNSVHISLNFDLSDKLNEEKLKAIADKYLKEIGFSEQPYLLYQHNDAGHPHIHIVTTNIRRDGSRIALHNLGKNQSEKARKEIEKEFGLTKAESKQRLYYELKPVDAQRVLYGKAETKRAITNVLNHVLPTYKYASLAELNAVLKQYNIGADRGNENSRIYKSNGLVYRIFDSKGQKVGVPIKASLIYNKPTLLNISAQFEKNDKEKQTHKRRVMSAIDFALLKQSNKSLTGLMSALQKEKIQVVLRQNDRGIIYGIAYVDFQTKCVFNGSQLGKQYSANAIQERCNTEQQILSKKPQANEPTSEHEEQQILSSASGISKIFEELIQPEANQFANEPPEQRKFKKRKRKQRHSHN